jgi:hypothetical protein
MLLRRDLWLFFCAYRLFNASLQESLQLKREIGDKQGIAFSLEGLATIARLESRGDLAARLLGSAAALREAIGAPLPSAERTDYDRDVAAVRAQLGEAAFAKAWAEGRAMTLEPAIDYALKERTSDTDLRR